ncbi:MAG: T9SS type A sorting domain-containing protein [Mariniphaga sp.]|nr:T9SS type A sorting domain-containing protein [Mariniphaga sp.]
MKKYIILLLLSLTILQTTSGKKGWEKINVIPQQSVCYSSGKVEKGFIPPPEHIVNRLKSGDEKTSNIIVTYIDFPDSVKSSFEYAIGIWEQLIESDVPIYITARWSNMSVNTLASCGPTGYYRNLDNFYYRNKFYPVAVAEKINGVEITGENSPDVSATFNKNVDWYTGTDGNCPDELTDLVSVVLHEMAHGLGFTGFLYAEEESGEYYDPPGIFDQYVANYQKQYLIDTSLFNNPSAELFEQLVSNALYFRSPATLFEGNGIAPRLFSPSSWDDGSSVYHLNENSYRAGNINSMMTPFAGLGEAVHNPGPIAMAILADIGWKNLFIRHDEHKDIEVVTEPVIIEASIESDYELDSTLLFVYYSSDFFSTYDSVFMVPTAKATIFSSDLSINIEQGIVSYYISATDKKQRTFNSPSTAPDSTYILRIGPDEFSPVINHQPREFILTSSSSMQISALANDNIGIDSVWVEYLYNMQFPQSQGMVNDSSNSYTGFLNLEPFQLVEGDSISYRIVAKDISSNQNISFLPEEEYFVVRIEDVFEPLTHYQNDFNDLSNTDFIHVDFEIKKTKEFIDGALHSLHPYLSPEQDDMYFNYTSQLKYPIVLLEGGQMNYDEIVLLEPGEAGTVFGDLEFWDFAIVEGSIDNGESWLPLADGYDSRSNLTWVIEYNNGINGEGNSTTTGKKEMFIRNNIDLLENGNFSAGDTILMRFRLFSDPYANGWGWIIDNLRIQNFVSVENQIPVSPGEFRIYPNPFNNLVTIELNTDIKIKNIHIVVYDGYGRNILNKPIYNVISGFKETLDLSELNAGIYLIQVFGEGQRLLSRKIIKQ